MAEELGPDGQPKKSNQEKKEEKPPLGVEKPPLEVKKPPKKPSETVSTAAEEKLVVLEKSVVDLKAKMDKLTNILELLTAPSAGVAPNPQQVSPPAPAPGTGQTQGQPQGQPQNPLLQQLLMKAIMGDTGGSEPSAFEKLALQSMQGAIDAQKENADFTRAIKNLVVGKVVKKKVEGLVFHETPGE